MGPIYCFKYDTGKTYCHRVFHKMEEMDTTEPDYTSWKKKRSRTRIIANILIFLYGVEDQSLKITMIFYFSQNFNMTHLEATFFYSIADTVFAVSNLISGAIFGRYIDKTRNLRFVILLNFVVLVFCSNLNQKVCSPSRLRHHKMCLSFCFDSSKLES